MIGLGYYDTLTPSVITRNVLENPVLVHGIHAVPARDLAGRLEALINFQTMVTDLTGLATANASMLDESTAVVEGMLVARRASKSPVGRLRGRRRRAAADQGARSSTARGRRRHRAASDPTSTGAPRPPTSSAVRRLRPVPRARRGACGTRPASSTAVHVRRAASWWSARRPPRPHAAALARLVRRRRRGRARRSASACRSASAVPTPATWRCARDSSASCPAASSACRRTPRATPRTGSRCRPASSTSAARRRPRTSARRRCCWPSWRRCTPVYHGPEGAPGDRDRRRAQGGGARAAAARLRPAARDGLVLRHHPGRHPGPRDG